MINTKHKDRLFCFIFGREENKKWTLSLYNAVNGSSHTEPDSIQITTMDDVLYMGMKNDVSFIIANSMSIYEQQSTYNPNMPIRELMYASRLYDKYIHENQLNIYGKTLIPLPVPKLVVFYNGKEDQEDDILELKDAFLAKKQLSETSAAGQKMKPDSPDIAVRVRMVNINYGKNRELLQACRPLEEYAWLIWRIREYSAAMEIEKSVDQAIDEMPEEFEIRPFLVRNKAEVRQMCITEYNEAETMQMFKEQGRKEGRKEGRNEVAETMIKANESGDKIVQYTGLKKEDVDKLARNLHIVLAWNNKNG